MFERKAKEDAAETPTPDAPRPDKAEAEAKPAVLHPATTTQKAVLAVILILVTLGVMKIGRGAIDRVEAYLARENRVDWTAPADAGMKPGPTSFWYDADKHELVHVGVIDQKRKSELIALFPAEPSEAAKQHTAGYWAAIDRLAFASQENMRGLIVALLALGGIAGLLGVQLRSMVNFVGHTCYTQSLDVITWWPYYALRPFIGFVLGVVIVIIIHAGFFAASGTTPNGTLWWAGIAFLAGFGEQEFTQKLRQLTKTLFGEGK